MAERILALTKDGKITYCTAPEELRGKGRCNHIAHQSPGQSSADFLQSIENKILVEGEDENEVQQEEKIVDQKDYIFNIVSKYAKVENPKWENVVKNIPNPFNIGKESDGSYEEATIKDFKQDLVLKPDGAVYNLSAIYEFRGQEYECDFGEVPAINADGTITMDNVNWRVLPVVEQNKAGLISYSDNIVVKQKDGRNISFIMSKDPEVDTIKIYGRDVSIDIVQNYLKTGDTTGLTSGQVYALNDIDPIVFERFPNFADDLKSLKELPSDEYGDLTWRRCIRYQDIVQDQMRLQMRRMGVTFRTNLAKQQKSQENDENLSFEELNEKYPLFYQVNLTDNIKEELKSRSNVQHAMDLNPIAALSQSLKISYTGPGGYHKDKAPYNLRMPHRSHEGIIDPMDISSGKNVGLTNTLYNGYIGEDRLIHKYKEGEKQTLAPSDFIPYREHNDPNRAIMAVAHMKQACPITGGEDPIVKTKAWNEIQGAKLGVNLRVAYIPSDGVFEDAVIISQSAADKMSTIQSQTYECREATNLKVGQRLEMKDKVGDVSIKVGGTVKSISDDGKTFEVETVYKMTPGNKLAGRHGNKSVVSKVLPDNEMPKIIENGKEVPAQVVMSPLSVVGRKNLGQVMECNETMGDGPVIDKKRTIVLPNGKRIEATGGVQYILRLNHIAEKKISSFSDEISAKREAEGSRVGEMESILLSTDEDRLKILDYLRHQEAYDSHNKLKSLLKAVGVDMSGVNW